MMDIKIAPSQGTNFILALLIAFLFVGRLCEGLQCYECSETFHGVWKPLACQTNITQVATRACNSEQSFCFVESVTVKGIPTRITRNCVDECFYGCRVSGFGFTAITCTSCCDSDLCNTGNHGLPYKLRPVSELWPTFLWCGLIGAMVFEVAS